MTSATKSESQQSKPASSELQTQKKAELLAAEALTYLEVVEGYTLSNVDELHSAEELLVAVKGKLKLIKQENEISTAQLVEEKKKLDAEKKRIDAWFKPAKDRYETMETRLKAMVAQFVLKQEAERKQLAEQARAANTIAEKAAIVKQVGETRDVSHAKGVTTRLVTKFEVTNPDAVPRDFCSPDLDLLKRAIDANPHVQIPGVRVFQDVVTSARG